MGLLKAAGAAISSTMHDQWKDLITCGDMGNDTLMMRKTTDSGAITKNTLIRVMPGQCAVIIANGKVLDATVEEGEYTFDENAAPSFFSGNFGAVFKDMWQRFTFGGTNVQQQAVYFFNMKEIMNNLFGTTNPIPFQDWSHPVPNQMTGKMTPLSVKVKCHGRYTFKIVDPALFMREYAGTAEVVKKDEIVEQMRAEVIGVFQNVVNELGTEAHQVPVLELPSQTDEIKEMMDEKVFDQPIRNRGLSIVVFVVESVTLDAESDKYIKEYTLASNANMQQGTMVGAYAQAVQDAAKNDKGAMNGFLGIGMMNGVTGNMFGNVQNNIGQNLQNVPIQEMPPKAEEAPKTEEENPEEPKAEEPADNKPTTVNSEKPTEVPPAEMVKTETWKCTKCGTENTGNFCANCGEKKPEPLVKKCPKCGEIVDPDAKFCANCGESLQ